MHLFQNIAHVLLKQLKFSPCLATLELLSLPLACLAAVHPRKTIKMESGTSSGDVMTSPSSGGGANTPSRPSKQQQYPSQQSASASGTTANSQEIIAFSTIVLNYVLPRVVKDVSFLLGFHDSSIGIFLHLFFILSG